MDSLRLSSSLLLSASAMCQEHAAQLAPNEPDVWYELGELAHIMGHRDEAQAAYERYH